MTRNARQTRVVARRSRGGFTLIELVAVMVIIAIIAATAAPALTSLGDSRGAVAARQVLRDIGFARQRALATGDRCWVVFDTAGETWSILAENPASPGRAGATVLTDMATGKAFTETIDVDSFVGVELLSAAIDGDVEIGFDWLGRPLNGAETNLAAQAVITLTGNHQVTVEKGTGHAAYAGP